MSNIVAFDAGEVFSGRKSGRDVPGWDAASPYTPALDPKYMYPPWAADIIVWLLSSKEPLYVFGPTGCGKTSCVKQLVARLNYPVYEVTGHNRLEFPELVGHHTVQQGSMKFEYGPLAMAMKNGGLFLINEVDLLDPSTSAGLNSVLDGYPLSIPENGGELIVPHPMFRFVATANSNGAGDSTGLYQGVLRQNLAALDRYVMVEAGYLAEAEELNILKNYVGKDASGNMNLPEDLLHKMVKYANAVRKLFVGEQVEGVDNQLSITFSTRGLLRWCHLAVQFAPRRMQNVDVIRYSLDRALAFKASPAERVVLYELLQRMMVAHQ